MPHVAGQALDGLESPGVAAVVLGRVQGAERQPRPAPRLFRAQAVGEVLLDLLLEVERDLRVEVTVGAVAPKSAAEPQDDRVEPAHSFPPLPPAGKDI